MITKTKVVSFIVLLIVVAIVVIPIAIAAPQLLYYAVPPYGVLKTTTYSHTVTFVENVTKTWMFKLIPYTVMIAVAKQITVPRYNITLFISRNLSTVIDYIVKLRRVCAEISGSSSCSLTPRRYLMPLARIAVVYSGYRIEGEVAESIASERVSSTNVQVSGIDELDPVKTDGRYIYIANHRNLYIVNVSSFKVQYKFTFSNDIKGLLIGVNRLVVITYPNSKGISYIFVFSTENEMKRIAMLSISGIVVAGRLYGKHVYLVINEDIGYKKIPIINGTPIDSKNVYILSIEPEDVYTTILALDTEFLNYSYKVFIVGATSRIYLSRLGNLYIFTRTPNTQSILVSLKSNLEELPLTLAKELTPYLEVNDILGVLRILASYLKSCSDDEFRIIQYILERDVFTVNTSIHLFKVQNLSIDYVASISLPGIIRDQFAVEEKNGSLILATTVVSLHIEMSRYRGGFYTYGTAYTGTLGYRIIVDDRTTIEPMLVTLSPFIVYEEPWVRFGIVLGGTVYNNFYVLNSSDLSIIAKIEGIAEREEVYAARSIGNLFLLVTYRTYDPIFAIDVSDVENPKVIGYLTMPGYSEYLHPLTKDLVLGIGVEGSGLKIVLIDISNPKKMSIMSKIVMPEAISTVLWDYHAFLLDPDYNYFVIPIYIYGRGYPRALQGLAIISYDLEESKLCNVTIVPHLGAFRFVYIGDKLFSISLRSVKVLEIGAFRVVCEIILS